VALYVIQNSRIFAILRGNNKQNVYTNVYTTAINTTILLACSIGRFFLASPRKFLYFCSAAIMDESVVAENSLGWK
jgi:hypothetical protein